MQDPQRARKFRRIAVFSLMALFFVVLFLFLARSAHALILPVVLGVFLGYLFRPLVRFIQGPPLLKYAKAAFLIGTIGALGYMGVNSVKNSLPSERERLELLVRLQNRLNTRYEAWMQVNPETGKGNVIYNLVGKDMDRVVQKLNGFLSLDADQRKLFLLYRQGYKGEAPIEDRYYDYFIQNLRIMQAVELEKEAQLAADTQRTVASAADTHGGGGNLGGFLKLLSTWLVFPLTFIFILLDKGDIQHFALGMVPNRYFELARTVCDKVDEALGRYIRGTMLECLLVGLTITTGLWLCGFNPKVVILVGIIGGVTNAIPFVGTALALIIGCVFALIAENINPLLPFITPENLILAVIGVVMLAHVLDNAIYQPLVVGSAVNLHPLAVILSVFAGSLAFGFAGLLLAIPLIVILKVVTQTLIQGLKAYRII